jgi:hypothetical protein
MSISQNTALFSLLGTTCVLPPLPLRISLMDTLSIGMAETVFKPLPCQTSGSKASGARSGALHSRVSSPLAASSIICYTRAMRYV